MSCSHPVRPRPVALRQKTMCHSAAREHQNDGRLQNWAGGRSSTPHRHRHLSSLAERRPHRTARNRHRRHRLCCVRVCVTAPSAMPGRKSVQQCCREESADRASDCCSDDRRGRVTWSWPASACISSYIASRSDGSPLPPHPAASAHWNGCGGRGAARGSGGSGGRTVRVVAGRAG